MKNIILLISLIVVIGCGTDQDSPDIYTYTIKNESGVDTKIIGYSRFDTYIINLKNAQQYTQVYVDPMPPRGYHFKYLFGSSDGNYAANSIKIIYNNSKFKIFDFDNLSSERNPLGPNHNDGGLEATYTINQKDYENAQPCNGNCD